MLPTPHQKRGEISSTVNPTAKRKRRKKDTQKKFQIRLRRLFCSTVCWQFPSWLSRPSSTSATATTMEWKASSKYSWHGQLSSKTYTRTHTHTFNRDSNWWKWRNTQKEKIVELWIVTKRVFVSVPLYLSKRVSNFRHLIRLSCFEKSLFKKAWRTYWIVNILLYWIKHIDFPAIYSREPWENCNVANHSTVRKYTRQRLVQFNVCNHPMLKLMEQISFF